MKILSLLLIIALARALTETSTRVTDEGVMISSTQSNQVTDGQRYPPPKIIPRANPNIHYCSQPPMKGVMCIDLWKPVICIRGPVHGQFGNSCECCRSGCLIYQDSYLQ